MPTVPLPDFPLIPGEAPGARLVRIIRTYDGCSLSARKDDLGALVARGVDDPAKVVGVSTNCAMFGLGILAAAGVDHALLRKPYVNGMAFSWLVQIGTDFGAWKVPSTTDPPPPGAFMWYRIPGTNDDHVEVFLSAPDEHGGGGRPNNAITVGHGPIHSSWSRPMWRYLDPDMLGIAVVDEHVDTPDPHT